MNGGDEGGNKPSALNARANGQSFLPRFATRALGNATSATKINGAPDKENNPTTMATGAHSRKQSASSLSDAIPQSPEVSRIPRPTSRASPRTRRRSLTLEEAFDLAEHRRAIGSPSPAPRPARQNSGSSEHRPLPHLFSQKPIDLGRLGKVRPGTSLRRDGTLSSKDSFGSTSRKAEESDSEMGRKLKQFEEDEKIIKSMKEDKKGLFIKPRISINGAGPRAAPARAPSNGNFGGNNSTGDNAPRPTWGNLHQNNPDWLKKFEPALKEAAEEDARKGVAGVRRKSPSASPTKPFAEQNSPLNIPRPATAAPVRSPDKSYAWQVDEDFTAGDLQVSNSPPVGFGRGNTKLEELRKLEAAAERRYPVESHNFPPQRTNTKLDEILQREREIERKYPIPRAEEPTTESIGELPPAAEQKTAFPSARPTKADGESDPVKKFGGYTKEAPAAAWSNGFREQRTPWVPYSDAQRITGFEVSHQPSSLANPDTKAHSQENDFGELGGQRIPDTPVTVYKNAYPKQTGTENNEPQQSSDPSADPNKRPSLAKEDSHDLLRKLARASSKSPSPSPTQVKPADKVQEDDKAAVSSADQEDKQAERADSDKKGFEVNGALRLPPAGGQHAFSLARPTVGFSGISRSASTKSVRSSQSRVSADPTARIEAEANLFALPDNMSERGSLRAPSPRLEIKSDPEAENVDADVTPRPTKVDPSSMPTPQVTGAYVETPAHHKFEQPDVKKDATTFARDFLPPRKKAELRNRDPSTSPRATKSDGYRERARATSLSKLRRSRSLPRYSLPLKNSVKPPTVKEDLRQIHLLNNIEDSTSDDFTDLIISSSNPEELEKILKDGVTEHDDVDDLTFEEQLKWYEQRCKSLDTGLASIRQAKKGIERLENQVAHAEDPVTAVKNEKSNKKDTAGKPNHHAHDPGCPHCIDVQQKTPMAYLHVPVPRLFHAQSRFRPTLLGFLLLFLSSWYFLENAFYDRWGRQYVCYRGSPCHYDVDDPEYGYVVPVKLDEWLTGGMIRPHAAHWMEEISDYYADAQDWWTGTDIGDIDWRAIRDPDWRRNHFRRMDKKDLWPEWNPDPEMMPTIEALERQRLMDEAAEAAEDPGDPFYGVHQIRTHEAMAKDDDVSGYLPKQPSMRWH